MFALRVLPVSLASTEMLSCRSLPLSPDEVSILHHSGLSLCATQLAEALNVYFLVVRSAPTVSDAFHDEPVMPVVSLFFVSSSPQDTAAMPNRRTANDV